MPTAEQMVGLLDRHAEVKAAKWVGPEPSFSPSAGAYVCAAEDGDKLRQFVDRGLLPLPGKIPGSAFIPLEEMASFQLIRGMEALNA